MRYERGTVRGVQAWLLLAGEMKLSTICLIGSVCSFAKGVGSGGVSDETEDSENRKRLHFGTATMGEKKRERKMCALISE